MKTIYVLLAFMALVFDCKRNSSIYEFQDSDFKNKEGIYYPTQREFQTLINEAINWAEKSKSIELLPVITDTVSGLVIGLNLNGIEADLSKLKESRYFSSEFIENYRKILITLDSKIRSKEYEEWYIGELPPFKFANGISPWCMCQGLTINALDSIIIVKSDSHSAEIIWKWNKESSWLDFKINLKNEEYIWKISYLEGFDYITGIKKDGEL